jgi:ribosomal protein S18 acetylase RimI-like enzyme
MTYIRLATLEDAEAMMHCRLAAITVSAASAYSQDIVKDWAQTFSKSRIQGFQNAILSNNETLYVAIVDDRVVGFGCLIPNKQEVTGVYVHPDYGQRGIGRQLLKRMIQQAQEMKLRRLHLHASLNAVPFYSACGFTVIKQDVHRLRSGREMPCALMEKTLPVLEIQRLHIHETDRLRKIRLLSLKDSPDAFGSTYQEVAAFPEDRWRSQLQTLPTFVAVLNGVDNGIVRSAPHTEQPHTAYLISMWVAPQARGQGIGAALIDALIEWGKAEGYQRLILDVGDSNDFAIALYIRKGFKPTGATGHLPPPREHMLEHEMALDL